MSHRFLASMPDALPMGGLTGLEYPWERLHDLGPHLAVAAAIFHGLYLIYQLLGGLLALLDRRWAIPHLLSLAWGVTVVAMQGHCPLTRLEKALYEAGGVRPYEGSFLNHYVYGTLLPDGYQAVGFSVYIALMVVTYGYLVRIHVRPRPSLARS